MTIEVLPPDTPHNGLCQSLWRPDVPCPNAIEFILMSTTNNGYALMCGPHKEGFLAAYPNLALRVEPWRGDEHAHQT